eukprot:9154823-Alexandrium_andersonii.AAC.1
MRRAPPNTHEPSVATVLPARRRHGRLPGGGAEGGGRCVGGRRSTCSGTLARHSALGPPMGPTGGGRGSIGTQAAGRRKRGGSGRSGACPSWKG